MILSLAERLEFVRLFPSSQAYSYSKGIVIALNSMYVEYGDKIQLEDYVCEVIDYFPIKVSIRPFPKLCTLTQLTLF